MRKDVVQGVGVLAVGAVGLWAVWVASQWRPEDGLFVVAVGWGIVAFSALNIVLDVRRSRLAPLRTAPAGLDGPVAARTMIRKTPRALINRVLPGSNRRIAGAMLLTIIYVFLWNDFGFLYSTMGFLAVMLLTLGVRRIVPIVAVSIGVPYFIDFTFGRLLSIPFP